MVFYSQKIKHPEILEHFPQSVKRFADEKRSKIIALEPFSI